jgi:hypothetical protein
LYYIFYTKNFLFIFTFWSCISTYISDNRKRERPQQKPSPGVEKHTYQHRLIISFDRDQFWFVCVRFTEKYLDYIADSTNVTVPSTSSSSSSSSPSPEQECNIKEDEIAQFQLIGPFGLENYAEMRIFVSVLLSVIFKEMQETELGKVELAALKSEVF